MYIRSSAPGTTARHRETAREEAVQASRLIKVDVDSGSLCEGQAFDCDIASPRDLWSLEDRSHRLTDHPHQPCPSQLLLFALLRGGARRPFVGIAQQHFD